MRPALLVLNAGSSSLKFQVFEDDEAAAPQCIFRGLFEGIGGDPHLVIRSGDGLIVAEERPAATPGRYGHEEALLSVAEWLRGHRTGYRLAAVGHRVVHGGLDYAAPVLTQAGLASAAVAMLSAGDGSESAFLRIRSGVFQTGTVAEPLNLHGWQLVDELNRLFAGQGVSGYVFPVHLVTRDNIARDGGDRLLYDPANGYRDVYRRIWQRP